MIPASSVIAVPGCVSHVYLFLKLGLVGAHAFQFVERPYNQATQLPEAKALTASFSSGFQEVSLSHVIGPMIVSKSVRTLWRTSIGKVLSVSTILINALALSSTLSER